VHHFDGIAGFGYGAGLSYGFAGRCWIVPLWFPALVFAFLPLAWIRRLAPPRRHRLHGIVSVAPLVVCVMASAFWLRSYWVAEWIGVHSYQEDGAYSAHRAGLFSADGRFSIAIADDRG
jgi:hypothetical protein